MAIKTYVAESTLLRVEKELPPRRGGPEPRVGHGPRVPLRHHRHRGESR
ncbi:hypothetical protein [Hymenobacter coccineus]